MLLASAGTGFDSLPSHHHVWVKKRREHKSYAMRQCWHLEDVWRAAWLTSTHSVAAACLSHTYPELCTNCYHVRNTNKHQAVIKCLTHRPNVSLCYVTSRSESNCEEGITFVTCRRQSSPPLRCTQTGSEAISATAGPFLVGKTAEAPFWSMTFTRQQTTDSVSQKIRPTLYGIQNFERHLQQVARTVRCSYYTTQRSISFAPTLILFSTVRMPP